MPRMPISMLCKVIPKLLAGKRSALCCVSRAVHSRAPDAARLSRWSTMTTGGEERGRARQAARLCCDRLGRLWLLLLWKGQAATRTTVGGRSSYARARQAPHCVVRLSRVWRYQPGLDSCCWLIAWHAAAGSLVIIIVDVRCGCGCECRCGWRYARAGADEGNNNSSEVQSRSRAGHYFTRGEGSGKVGTVEA